MVTMTSLVLLRDVGDDKKVQPPTSTGCTGDVWLASDILEVYKICPENIQSNLKTFFKTGESECLYINQGNIHYYFHIAWLLNYSSLIQTCVTFLCGTEWILRHSDDQLCCACNNALNLEMQKLHVRGGKFPCSAVAVRRANRPEYLVLFTCNDTIDSPQHVSVLDLRTMNMCSTGTNKWKRLDRGYAVCSLHVAEVPYVLTSGGRGKSAGKFYRYDVVRDKWDRNINMNHPRSGHTMSSVGDKIYLIGGRESDVIEVVHPESSSCTDIGRLPVAVHTTTSAVYDNTIFIFGGEIKTGCVPAVQSIDTKSKAITRLTDLPCDCSGGSAVAWNDSIFIASQQGHMIKYDPISGHSELCNHQPFSRKQFAMFTQGDAIFLLGGVRTDRQDVSSCTLCKYSPDHNHWEKTPELAKSMNILASCLVQYPKSCPILPFSSAL